jgi:hypothetical protein
MKYKVVVGSHSHLRGLQALKKKGIKFCVKQLNLGIEHFARILAGDYSRIQECFNIDNFPWSLTENDSDAFEMNTYDDDNDEDDEHDDDYHHEINV